MFIQKNKKKSIKYINYFQKKLKKLENWRLTFRSDGFRETRVFSGSSCTNTQALPLSIQICFFLIFVTFFLFFFVFFFFFLSYAVTQQQLMWKSSKKGKKTKRIFKWNYKRQSAYYRHSTTDQFTARIFILIRFIHFDTVDLNDSSQYLFKRICKKKFLVQIMFLLLFFLLN